MQVLKFGGASVKDASGVRNLEAVLRKIKFEQGVVVISAMGKMTNAFEAVVRAYFDSPAELDEKIDLTYQFHLKIVEDLFGEGNENVMRELDLIYKGLNSFLEKNKHQDYNFVYDAVVSQGEIISTLICSAFLHVQNVPNTWVDARKLVITNNLYRKAKVNWEVTQEQIQRAISLQKISITQGFIGSNAMGETTTLGREGSDYTAAIFAYCLDADEVLIFKDVAGVLNGDPKYFENTRLLEKISFQEAIEMSFYGATIIHPKTIQPLKKKKIPLKVKSFIHPELPGTVISDSLPLYPKMPIFIQKGNQILLSISDKSFDFVAEEDLSEIFELFYKYNLRVNLMQNSAISFSVCLEDIFNNFHALIEVLQKKFKVLYNLDVKLLTIRHFDEQSVQKLEKDQVVLLKQISRETTQIIVKQN